MDSERAKEFARLYAALPMERRRMADEYVNALIAGDTEKCERMMREARECGNVSTDQSGYTYFEVDGMARDLNNKPCPAGARLKRRFETDKSAVDFLSRIMHIDAKRIRVISRERYYDKYDDVDDEE